MKRLVMILLWPVSSYATLTVITGPMFSGKSLELIRMGIVYQTSSLRLFTGKYYLDGNPHIYSRATEQTLPAVLLHNVQEFEDATRDAQAVLLDEVQFFDAPLVNVIRRLVFRHCNVIVAGLDMDYRGLPFGECMPSLCAMATQVIKLKARCNICNRAAGLYSQRLVDGVVVPATAPTVVLEGTEHTTYQARCENCYVAYE